MGTCNKADGSGSVVLRNSTTLVMHMKVYDESIQLGEAGGETGQRSGLCLGVAAETPRQGVNGSNKGQGSTHHPSGPP